MTLHRQTLFGPQNGNCWSACLAMILDAPLPCVPHFMRDAAVRGVDGEQLTNRWLNDFGLQLFPVHRNGEMVDETCRRLPTILYALLSGESARFPGVGHTVVIDVRATAESGELRYYDPHPSDAGLIAIWALDVIVPLPREAA